LTGDFASVFANVHRTKVHRRSPGKIIVVDFERACDDWLRKPGREESREKYARLWFDGLAKFHRIENAAVWEFDEF